MLFQRDDLHSKIIFTLIRTPLPHRRRGARWVTFVTGIANDLTMWTGQVLALERDFRILRYDLRGHGGSEATRGALQHGAPGRGPEGASTRSACEDLLGRPRPRRRDRAGIRDRTPRPG